MNKLLVILASSTILLATGAQAAPVQRTVMASLSMGLGTLAPVTSGTGTVTVDTATGKVVIPAGLVTLTSKVLIPVPTNHEQFLLLYTLANDGGTLSQGGATNQLPGEICPGGGAACVGGGGFGGQMGFQGWGVVQLQAKLDIVVDLNSALIGRGGSTNSPFTFDAAAWTNGAGVVATPNGTLTMNGSGSIGGPRITFVSPTYTHIPNDLFTLPPLLTSLTLDFVPEPNTLLLLGAGVAGFALVVHRRR